MSKTASSTGPGMGRRPITTSQRSGLGIRPSVASTFTARIERETNLTVARIRAASLGGEWYRPCSGERLAEPGEHCEVGVNPHTIDAASAQRGEAVFVLEPAELALHGGAAPVETLPLVRSVGDRGQRDRATLAQADDRNDSALDGLREYPVCCRTPYPSRTSRLRSRERGARPREARRTGTRCGGRSRPATRAEARCACRRRGAACTHRTLRPCGC